MDNIQQSIDRIHNRLAYIEDKEVEQVILDLLDIVYVLEQALRSKESNEVL